MILGFDTSTAAAAAAVLRPDETSEAVVPGPERLHERPAHASELLPAIHEVMRRAGAAFTDLEAIAVGLGPGSFTGLRIGIATARALGKASTIPLRGVPSLAALAADMGDGLRLPLIDAKRGEVYAAIYDGANEVWAARAAPLAVVLDRVGSERSKPLAAGDGSLRFRHELEAAGVAVAAADSPLHVVSALSICRLARDLPDVSPEQLLPNYLREPDARPR